MKEFGARRPREARSANVSAVLRYLLANGPTSRVDLAGGIGLTQGPVTRIASLLLEQGLVSEGEALPTPERRGRPRVPIALNPEAWHTLSVHIGSSQLAVWRVDLTGNVLEELAVEHDGDPLVITRSVTDLCGQLSARFSAPLLGVGTVVGGWVDSRSGTVRLNEAMGWKDVPIGPMLSEALGSPVIVESAARAHAVADMLYGAAAGEANFLHFFIGNVIEMATVVDGRVMSGPSGFGGDLSHWLVADGQGLARRAEDLISGLVARDVARTEGIIDPQGTYEDLVALARSEDDGHRRAKEIISGLARSAAHLVAGVSKTFPTPMIIVSSGVVAIPEAIAALTAEFDELMSGYPVPRMTIAPQYRQQLATGGSAVVVEHALKHDRLLTVDVEVKGSAA